MNRSSSAPPLCSTHPWTGGTSPAKSDTASADSTMNSYPDLQLEKMGSQLIYSDGGHGTPPTLAMEHHSASFEPGSAKRIKTECMATSTMTNAGNVHGGLGSLEVAALTPQLRRKFKIGILKLIDDVVTRYPAQS